MPAADRTTPETIKKKLRKKKPTRAPSTTDRTSPSPKPTPVRKATPVARARAQEKQYVSQGKAVEKTANKQRRTRQRTAGPPKPSTEARRQQLLYQAKSEGISGSRTGRHRGFTPSEVMTAEELRSALSTKRSKTLTEKQLNKRILQTKNLVKSDYSAGAAPVLKVLEQTTRTTHASAAAARQKLKEIKQGDISPSISKDVAKAAWKGLKNEDKSTYSDVARDLGVKNKGVATGLGITGDILFDPLTYASGGTTSVGRTAALKAGAKAEKKALKKGLTGEQAKRFGERAARQAEKKAGDARGVTLRMGSREVPGMARGTAAVGQAIKKASDKPKVVRRVKDATRHVVADVRPSVARPGQDRVLHESGRRATRTARARANRGISDAQQTALGIRAKIGEENYRKVIDALEAGDLRSLSPELRDAAVRVRSQLRYANRMRKQAGIKGGERKNYVPHVLTDEAKETAGKTVKQSVGRKTIVPSSSKSRKREGPLKDLRETHPGEYNEDLAEIVGGRMAEGHESVARANLNRSLAAKGRDVRKGRDVPSGEGETAVFHIQGSDIRQVTDRKDLQELADKGFVDRKGGKGGRYVILDKKLVEESLQGVTPELRGPGIVKGLDRAQGGFKSVATATPGFHVRNLIGDTQNAYLGQSGHRMPKNMVHASRVLKAIGRREKGLRNLEPGSKGAATLKTKRYGDVTYDEVAKQLIEHGAARSGYMSRDIGEMLGSGKKRFRTPKLPQSIKRAGLNREDLPRLTTAVEGLRRGDTWEQAAARVAEFHFDYQDLTNFERQIARRAAPFYTFTARNIPLQSKTLLTRPGKFAQVQKIREEAAKASGVQEDVDKARGLYDDLKKAGVDLPKGWEKGLTEWEQRAAAVPVSWKGQKFTLSFGLPLQDLGEFPGAAGKNQLSEWYQKMMSLATPIGKNPVEYFENHSFFFRDEIQRSYSPNVAAPSYVAKFPDPLKEKLGVTKIRDKKTGKLVWAWPGKMDYLAKMVPGSPAFVQQLMTGGSDRQGKGTKERVAGFMGVKAVPVDPVKTAINLAYERKQEIDERMASLRQQPNPANGEDISAKNPTPEYSKLNEQLKIVNRIAYRGKQQAGYKILPTQGGPKKLRKKSSSSSSGGTQDLFGRSRSRSSSSGDVFGRGSGGSSSSGPDVFGR